MLWREKELLSIIEKEGKLKTTDIVKKSDMCKVTVLKYLNRLRGKGLVDYEKIGPTKLWFVIDHGRGPIGGGGLTNSKDMIFKLLEEFEKITGKRAIMIATADDLATSYQPISGCQ
jgi:predicted ArsR family transcriptional regulator